MAKNYRIYPPGDNRKSAVIAFLNTFFVYVLSFCLMLAGCYLFFTMFDTPDEHTARLQQKVLAAQYKEISARYDTVELVLDNVIERDKNVFRILFESEPYDFDELASASRWETYDRLSGMSESALFKEMSARLEVLENGEKQLSTLYDRVTDVVEKGNETDHIPAIQPVINKELTLLTASYGMRIHPFYKSLVSHQGVDYTVPIGSRVFATADGTVREIATRKTTSGMNIVISHGNGYETQYSHLSRIDVKKGQTVRRGDIIGLTGNSGLSLSPHLHYEVRHNGMRVDPIHYFFMELSPHDYQRIIRIAQSGMQSFD